MSGYIGTQPVPQATQTRDSFTATSGQTSFATGGYTPNFLDVYLNGVKLASADYTATNGSDVVLASGAATGDILEVVAYTAFDTANVTGATNFTVTGAFTSQGIDDNGNATALTIDSSESVLIGKTAFDDGATKGFTHYSGGGDSATFSTRSNNPPLILNRLNSNGEILRIRKDGATVGSIGNNGGYLHIGSPQGTDAYIGMGSSQVYPATSTGDYRDAAIDLGGDNERFKDLYLSGGVYLGGTGAANKLDDYEYGTWTPVFAGASSAGTYTYVENQGHYVKIGNQVTCWFNFTNITTVSAGSGVSQINGLPFTVNWMSGFNGEGVGIFSALGFTGINGLQSMPILHDNETYVRLYKLSNSNNMAASVNVTDKVNSGSDLRGFVTYTVSG